MPIVRDIRLWFFPRRRFKPPLKSIISPYDLREADEQQRLLMLAGAARSPQDAKLLMKKYGTDTALATLEKLPPPRKPSLRRRFILLVRRIEGHSPTRIQNMKPDDQINVRYKYRYRYDK